VNELSANFKRFVLSILIPQVNCLRMNSYTALVSCFSFLLSVQGEVLNLVEPPNYAAQSVPDFIRRDNSHPDNPITNLGALLGRVLFYDRRLSSSDQVSCGSCHQQQHAFSDPDDFSKGVNGITQRRSMRLINVRFSNEHQMFWDERARDIETQTTMPIRDHLEMGFSGQEGQPPFEELLSKLRSIEEYRILFSTVSGDSSISESRIQIALAQLVKSMQSFYSIYDKGRSMVTSEIEDFPNFTEAQNRGKRLFNVSPLEGGTGCASCHRPPPPPNSESNPGAKAMESLVHGAATWISP
jgi:cytochrome c peroxidase